MSFVIVDASLFPLGVPADLNKPQRAGQRISIEILSGARLLNREEYRIPCIAAFLADPLPALGGGGMAKIFSVTPATTPSEAERLSSFIRSYAKCTLQERRHAEDQFSYYTLWLPHYTAGTDLRDPVEEDEDGDDTMEYLL
jgi:hypothetical protein